MAAKGRVHLRQAQRRGEPHRAKSEHARQGERTIVVAEVITRSASCVSESNEPSSIVIGAPCVQTPATALPTTLSIANLFVALLPSPPLAVVSSVALM